MSMRKRKFGIELDAGIVEGPRGLSIERIAFKETLENGNNVYEVFLENDKKIGELVSNKGNQGDKGDKGDKGRGILSVSKKRKVGLMTYYEILYTDNTTDEFAVEDGQNSYELWIGMGNDGTLEDFLETYRGYSISSIELKEEMPGVGNKYEIGIESGKKIGEIIAPIGPNGDVNFATFEIIDGYLYATYTRNTEHMKFAINENGELEVTING